MRLAVKLFLPSVDLHSNASRLWDVGADVFVCDGSGSDNQIRATVYAEWEEERGQAEGSYHLIFNTHD